MENIDRRIEMDSKYEDAVDNLSNDHWYVKWEKYKMLTPEVCQY